MKRFRFYLKYPNVFLIQYIGFVQNLVFNINVSTVILNVQNKIHWAIRFPQYIRDNTIEFDSVNKAEQVNEIRLKGNSIPIIWSEHE